MPQLVGILHFGLELLLLGMKLRADPGLPQRRREADGGGKIVRHRQQAVGRGGRKRIVEHSLLAEDVEQARQTDGDAYAGELAVGVVGGKIVVAAAGADRADLAVVVEGRFIDRAGVVVQTARDRRSMAKFSSGTPRR